MTETGVILIAGILAGCLDLSATTMLVKARGISFQKLLQTIASGVLGPPAYKQGAKSAVLGLFFHFFIASTAATVYCITSRYLTILLDHPYSSGVFFGIAVHLFMTFVVIPLSAAPAPFSAKAFLTQLVIHILFVGLPIAFTVRHFSATAIV
ncbi:MAG: hypothetical protein JWQ42_3388 [Edaphobacter sp.]|jgi:hypothetical protein|nr:hypothetical protein [Edaphobacter sp.]